MLHCLHRKLERPLWSLNFRWVQVCDYKHFGTKEGKFVEKFMKQTVNEREKHWSILSLGSSFWWSVIDLHRTRTTALL